MVDNAVEFMPTQIKLTQPGLIINFTITWKISEGYRETEEEKLDQLLCSAPSLPNMKLKQ